jgi:peptidoglycan hydrolase CwlO-like protein
VRRRSLVVTLATAAVTIGLAAPQLASSAPTQDPRAQREQVRAERAQVAAQIDTSKASLQEIDAALQTLEENLRTQQAALARTEAQVAQAEQDLADAEAAIARLTDEVSVLKTEIRRRAVAAYVSPPGDDILTVLETNDFTTATNRKFYIELRAAKDEEVTDRLNGAASDLTYQKRKATEAKALAETKRAEQQERTDAVAQAESEQQRVADDLQSTIDSQISRSLELAKTDRALSAEIAEQQAALVARLAAQQAKEDADRKAAAAAAAAQPTNQDSSGGETGPLPPVSTGGGGTGTGGISLCTVGGITVNCAVRGQLQSMLNAARASGLSLSGGGYRSPAGQIEVRKNNCGTSYYAIWEMPASACSPPTAKPGTSQHELGLAIDFNNCSSRGSACYRWLAGNASSYGFYNLPSEPWHWSTTGN